MPSKPQVLGERLKAMAIGLGPEAKIPTVAQLCQSLEVSTTTLNLALRQLERDGIITRRNGVGLFVGPNVRAKNSQTVALVCNPDYFRAASHSPFWDLLIEESQRRATLQQQSFGLHFSLPDEASGGAIQAGLLREIEEGDVQGVLGMALPIAAVEQLDESVPFVAFAGPGDWRVGLDFCRLIEMGVTQLARQGCQRVGLWMPTHFISARESFPRQSEIASFRAALAGHGLPFYPDLIENGTGLENGWRLTQEQGYELAGKVFERPRTEWPDGMVVTDDTMTRGILVALQKLNLRGGRDVAIVSHANRNSPVLEGHEDELSLLEFDPTELVGAMFEMLETLMKGQTPPVPSLSIVPHIQA